MTDENNNGVTIGTINQLLDYLMDPEAYLKKNTAYCDPTVIDEIMQMIGLPTGDEMAAKLLATEHDPKFLEMHPVNVLFIHTAVAAIYEAIKGAVQTEMAQCKFASRTANDRLVDYLECSDPSKVEEIINVSATFSQRIDWDNMPKHPETTTQVDTATE